MKNYLLMLLMAVALVACADGVKPGDDADGSATDGRNGAQVGAVDGDGGVELYRHSFNFKRYGVAIRGGCSCI